MASVNNRAAVASGADLGDAARRRTVPGAPQQPGAVPQPQADDKKKDVKKQPSPLDVLLEWEWLIAPIIFTALAFFTRFYKIGLSNIVTWDEAQYVCPSSVRHVPSSMRRSL
jgi:dolichyl-phosphate-mannose-protein mannosyltransferase